jgi:hypothetical protein
MPTTSSEVLEIEKWNKEIIGAEGTVDCQPVTLDVGLYLTTDASLIPDLRKAELLLNHWKPPPGYEFPYSEHKRKGKMEKRYVSHRHL